MMRHAVLGGGNLGLDLIQYLKKDPLNDVRLFSRIKRFKYPCSLDEIFDYRPDHVWCTIGAGSVEAAKKDYAPFLDLHVRLVVELAQKLNANTFLHAFSSDYAAIQPKKSLYAMSKSYMEMSLSILKRPHTKVYRVGSLFGLWKPHACFPYKLKKYHPHPIDVYIPDNFVSPTSTSWVAKVLTENLDKINQMDDLIVPISPMNNVPLIEWAKSILGPDYAYHLKEQDKERPHHGGALGCPFEHVYNLELWQVEWQKWIPILDGLEK